MRVTVPVNPPTGATVTVKLPEVGQMIPAGERHRANGERLIVKFGGAATGNADATVKSVKRMPRLAFLNDLARSGYGLESDNRLVVGS